MIPSRIELVSELNSFMADCSMPDTELSINRIRIFLTVTFPVMNSSLTFKKASACIWRFDLTTGTRSVFPSEDSRRFIIFLVFGPTTPRMHTRAFGCSSLMGGNDHALGCDYAHPSSSNSLVGPSSHTNPLGLKFLLWRCL